MYSVLHILQRDDESGEKTLNNLLVLSSLWFMCLYALKVSHTASEGVKNCESTKEKAGFGIVYYYYFFSVLCCLHCMHILCATTQDSVQNVPFSAKNVK